MTDYIASAEKLAKRIYPLTVVMDRYNGTYSGGKWVAFNLEPDEVPEDAQGDDVACCVFYSENRVRHGVGGSVYEAIIDLYTRMSDEELLPEKW